MEVSMANNEDLVSVFTYYANDKGDLPSSKLGDVLRVLGLNPTEAELETYQAGFHPGTNITIEQFVPVYEDLKKVNSKYSADDLVEGLKQFDREGNGCISTAELRHLLSNLGEKLTNKELDQLLVGIADKDGFVDCEELVDIVLYER